MTAENKQILDAIRKKHCMRKVEIAIPRDSRKNVKDREGVLRIRYDRFEIKQPKIPDKNKSIR
jgi:hypothetical protein